MNYIMKKRKTYIIEYTSHHYPYKGHIWYMQKSGWSLDCLEAKQFTSFLRCWLTTTKLNIMFLLHKRYYPGELNHDGKHKVSTLEPTEMILMIDKMKKM